MERKCEQKKEGGGVIGPKWPSAFLLKVKQILLFCKEIYNKCIGHFGPLTREREREREREM